MILQPDQWRKQNHKGENLFIHRASFRGMKASGLILNREILLSLCVRDFGESNPSSSTLKPYNEKKTEQFNSGELRIFFRVNFHKYFIGLAIVGKHPWQQEEEQKGDISTALMFQEQLFTSERLKDTQDVVSLILHYRTM